VHIRFEDIPDQGLDIEINEYSWFPATEVGLAEVLTASVHLAREREKVFARGVLVFQANLACDRCLEEYQLKLGGPFTVAFELMNPEMEAGLGTEHVCKPAEMDVVFLREPRVDVDQLFSQQVLLFLPVKRLCREGCRGLCPRCGQNLNLSACQCRREELQSPFAVLKKLQQ